MDEDGGLVYIWLKLVSVTYDQFSDPKSDVILVFRSSTDLKLYCYHQGA